MKLTFYPLGTCEQKDEWEILSNCYDQSYERTKPAQLLTSLGEVRGRIHKGRGGRWALRG